MKAMVAAWGETSEDEEQEKDPSVALMANSGSGSDGDQVENVSQLKDQVRKFSKAKLEKFVLFVLENFEQLQSENDMVNENCIELKRTIRKHEHVKKTHSCIKDDSHVALG